MKNIMTIRIRGKNYKLKFVPRLISGGQSIYGLADYGAKTIRVNLGMHKRGKKVRGVHKSADELLMDTILHEICHMYFPDMPEKEVLLMGNELARVLTRVGFKL